MTDPETIAALRKELVEYRESLRHAHECYRGLEQQIEELRAQPANETIAAQRLAKLREATTCAKCKRTRRHKWLSSDGMCGTCVSREERRQNCRDMWGRGRRGY